ncbi:MAG: hypothetical protein ACREJO_02615 [Phycisphaerales bacterium]
MIPESFNAALATRKLEAIDILLIQAKRGSDADRIRAASAILRMAFMDEPKPKPAAKNQQASAAPTTGAPESPPRSEEIPGEPPKTPAPSPCANGPSSESSPTRTPQSLDHAVTPPPEPITPSPEPRVGYDMVTGRALYSP